MNCPKCGAPLRENAVFCTACGTRVAETPQQPSRLKSTMPLDGQSAPKAEAPAAQPEQTPVRSAAPEAPAAAPVVTEPPVKPAKPAKKKKGPSKFVTVLHHIRAYLAVILAVLSIVLLFLPWINAAMEVTIEDVKVRNSKQDLTFGDIDADNELSILDILRVEEATDVLDLTLDDDEAAAALKEQGKSARERINEFIGVTKDIEITKGFKLPTGVVAAAPQLVCILLMLICFVIGVIRVFAAETLEDGSPRTGWLKAGGIIGIVMSVLTAVEVFAINQFYDRVVDGIESFHGDLELSVRLLFGFALFAIVCVALTLLATHWGGKKKTEETV